MTSAGSAKYAFKSTRGGQSCDIDTALVQGIASDGGLFMPESLPALGPDQFAAAHDIQEVGNILLRPFFAGSALENDLEAILAETLAFPIPVTPLHGLHTRLDLLELYHGPTAAFKDVGAAFLAACLSRLEGDTSHPLTILVATSGDTGGAVAAAFNNRPGMQVVVLFPDGRVSERQQRQLTCWGENVLSLAINGSFDDCQALVKGALADDELAGHYRFSSANSINIGRLLPQSIYYANASIEHYRDTGRRPGFIIPTGNLGNAMACVLAREMGLPIGPLVLATNKNRTIADFLLSGQWSPRDSIATLASAMDVGNPSNMERLRTHYGDAETIAQHISAVVVSDDEIKQQIRLNMDEFGIATCPHTATATCAWRQMDQSARESNDWIAVATAHPAKFERIVEPVIGAAVPVPPELQRILEQPSRFLRIEPDSIALRNALQDYFDDLNRNTG